jgi:hypothetical protein
LVHATAIADFDAEQLHPEPGELALPEQEIVSDTGELTWLDASDGGQVVIETPNYTACVGHAGHFEAQQLDLDLETPFAAVQLISLDGAPLSESGDLLLVTAARVANTGMRWQDATRQSLGQAMGEAPTRIEPVKGKLHLREPADAQGVEVQPLDGMGQPMGDAQSLESEEGGFVLELTGSPATLWYRLKIDR